MLTGNYPWAGPQQGVVLAAHLWQWFELDQFVRFPTGMIVTAGP